MNSRSQAESAFGSMTSKETQLIEILYADEQILDSLAAMLTEQQQPEIPETPAEPERRQPKTRQSQRPDAGLLIDTPESVSKGQPTAKEPELPQSSPHLDAQGDARIVAILQSLAVPKTKGSVLPSSERSLLVHLEGQLQYYNKRTYEKIMRKQTSLRLLLDQPDASVDADPTAVNLEALNLEPAKLGEDDLSGYADTLGGAVLAFLPPGPGFFLTLRGSKRPFYVPTPGRSLRYAPRRIEDLFPSFSLGNWNVIAYYPAATKSSLAKSDSQDPPTLLGLLGSLMGKQSEILAACGFPAERLQPILIYRDVAIADI